MHVNGFLVSSIISEQQASFVFSGTILSDLFCPLLLAVDRSIPRLYRGDIDWALWGKKQRDLRSAVATAYWLLLLAGVALLF
jgi:hypothetical protein